MLRVMPSRVYEHWQAYYLLKDPDYRQEQQWKVMDKVEFKQEQSAMIRQALEQAAGGNA